MKTTKDFVQKVKDSGFVFRSKGFVANVVKFNSIHELHRFPVGYDVVDHVKSRAGGRIKEMSDGEFSDNHWTTGYTSATEAMSNAKMFKNDKFVQDHDEWRRCNPGIAESFVMAPRRTLVRGDYGSELDTQKYLAGKVDTMWSRRQKVKREKRNHKIVMMQGGNVNIKPKDMNLTAIAAMEMMLNIGPQAEFVVVNVNANTGVLGNTVFDTIVKKSGSAMCRSTASYASSVMMFRIGIFSILESIDGLDYGYGRSAEDSDYMKYIEETYNGATLVPRIKDKAHLEGFLKDFREGKLKPIGANQ